MNPNQDSVPSIEERRRLFLVAERNAKTLLKKGDRIRISKCPGTKRWATFERWDGHWIVSRSGINDFAPGSIDRLNGEPVDFTAEPFVYPAPVSLKPLFIPLRKQYFQSFKALAKFTELRRYGLAWNERTCLVGRAVVLSCGYGKQSRLTGTVVAFERVPAQNLSSDEQADVLEVFGTLDLEIAKVHIGDVLDIEVEHP